MPASTAGLRIQSRLNGEIMQDANTDDMVFPVDQTIAISSEVMTLEPGHVVDIEIEGVGVPKNPAIDGSEQV